MRIAATAEKGSPIRDGAGTTRCPVRESTWEGQPVPVDLNRSARLASGPGHVWEGKGETMEQN
jgi:hypothetical protein